MASKKNNDPPKKEMLTVTHITTKELKKIKYTEIKQAYNLFVSALKFEPESVRNKEHFWVLGIDAKGYVVCVYMVSLGSSNVTMFAPAEIFQYAMQRGCVQIIFAHNHPTETVLKVSEQDLETTNWLFHAARYLNIQLLDHLIINLKTFLSLSKTGEMKKIETDMKFKTYDEIKPKLDDEKERYGKQQKLDGIVEKATEIVKNLLGLNITDMNILSKATGFTIKEIKKIEKEIQIDLVKNMLKLSPDEIDEIDEIVKISKLTKKEVLKIKKDTSSVQSI